MVGLRPATMADSDILFAWANDPVTRAWSGSTAPIPREDHDRWMMFNVGQGYPAHMVIIAENDEGAVGVVRFDADRKDVMTYRASMTIAPKHRGKGLAYQALSQALSWMRESTIKADIRPGNFRSRRTFERCGFKETGSDHDWVYYRREPVL